MTVLLNVTAAVLVLSVDDCMKDLSVSVLKVNICQFLVSLKTTDSPVFQKCLCCSKGGIHP